MGCKHCNAAEGCYHEEWCPIMKEYQRDFWKHFPVLSSLDTLCPKCLRQVTLTYEAIPQANRGLVHVHCHGKREDFIWELMFEKDPKYVKACFKHFMLELFSD